LKGSRRALSGAAQAIAQNYPCQLSIAQTPTSKIVAKHNAHIGLTDQEEAFVSSIARGESISEAARIAGIARNTGRAWLKRGKISDAIAYEKDAREETRVKVTQQYQATRTQVILTEVDEKLKVAAVKAVDVIIDIMKNGKRDVDRLAACDRVIKLAGITEKQTIAQGTERITTPRGLSEEMADSIRKRILGIVEAKEEEPQPVTVEAPVGVEVVVAEEAN
jgi:hypothetical protein